ncbi:MAG: GDP-mannose 4,6-dehydratase [Acidobacteria bacterium]|nr:GDP-mannose 4,6-dehydratase [Acidobacteriota bacterium]
MKTALVTGVNGFSASHLVKRLQADAVRVIGLDVQAHLQAVLPDMEYHRVDVGDFEALSRTIRRIRPDGIFHLAAIGDGPFQDVFRTNALGTIHLLESVLAAGIDARILLVGSAAEYGRVGGFDLPVTEETACRPVTPYGLSKHFATLAGQSYFRRYGLKVVIARVFNLVGAGIPKSLVVGALLARARSALRDSAPPVVKAGNINSRRDFVSVTDAVEVYLQMAGGEFWGEIFNICSGRDWSIDEVVGMLFAHSPRPIDLEVDPALVRASEVDTIYGCNDKARRLLGFEIRTTLEEALRAAWEHEFGGGGQ